MTLEDAGLLLVHGEEPHLVDRTVAAWRAAASGDIEVLDAPTRLEPLIASLVDMPLFAAQRHVLVRDLPQLVGARKAGTGVSELVRALSLRAPSTQVCFAVRTTVTPANPVLAAVEANRGRLVHHPQLRPGERRQWLDAEVRARSLRLPSGAADILLRCSGGDLGTISGELDKIAARGGHVTLVELQQLVAGSEQLQLYAVLEQLGGAQPAAGAALLIDLIAEGRSPQYLLSILAGQLRDMLMAHAVMLRGERGTNAVATALRLPAWRAERVLRTAQSVPATLAMSWMRALQRIDAGLKSGDVDDVLALQRWALTAAASVKDYRLQRTA